MAMWFWQVTQKDFKELSDIAVTKFLSFSSPAAYTYKFSQYLHLKNQSKTRIKFKPSF